MFIGCGKNSESDTNQKAVDNTTESSEITSENISTAPGVEKEELEPIKAEKETATEPEEITTEEVIKPTENPTKESENTTTKDVSEVKTQAPTEAPTQKPTTEPIQTPTETVTQAVQYDIESFEYQEMVKSRTLYYINQFRAQEGHQALTISYKASEFCQGRSTQLLTNFAHNTKDERVMAEKLQYGEYVDAAAYGMDCDPYWEPYGAEAIAKVAGSVYTDADTIALTIANLVHNSKGHWKYIGAIDDVYSNYIYFGMGMSYKGGEWYICMNVLEQHLD